MLAPQITVSTAGDALVLTTGNGSSRAIDVATLWTECRSAAARRRRIDGVHLTPPGGLRITATAAAGHYGLHVAFSADAVGGVYPWPMLNELGRRPQMHDFITS